MQYQFCYMLSEMTYRLYKSTTVGVGNRYIKESSKSKYYCNYHREVRDV